MFAICLPRVCLFSQILGGRTERANTAHEIGLLMTVLQLQRELLACEGVQHRMLKVLKNQFDGRVGGRGFKYPATVIGKDFRSDHTGKLNKGPPQGRNEVEYLQGLAEKMMAYDLEVGQIAAAPVVRLARNLPSICAQYTLARMAG